MPLSCQPLTDKFGVGIDGVDLKADISEDLLASLLDALYTHSVLLFRGQEFEPADYSGLLHRFGRPKVETRKQFNLHEYPVVSTVGNIVDEDGKALAFFNRGGEAWHTDGTAACHTNAATFLYAVEVPKQGGDTMYCSTAYAYECLPDELKERLDGVRMLCSFHTHNDRIIARDPKSHEALTPEERLALPDVWHDIVQTHPVTARKSLYLNRQPIKFEGINDEEGRAIIPQLIEFASQSHLVYRHRWTPGDLIIWDNLSTLHSATDVGPYEDDRRLMFRSFVYMMPTTHPLENLSKINSIFTDAEGKGALSLS